MSLLLKKFCVSMCAGVMLTSFTLQGAEFGSLLAQKENNAQQKKKEENWQKYTYKENGFSVALPTAPEHVQQSVEIPSTNYSINYDTYVSEPSDAVVYVISVWNYPAEIDMSQPEVNLQDGFNGMLSSLPNSQVQEMKMRDRQGFKSLEFFVKSDDIFFRGELVLVYNTLYQVFVVYRNNEVNMDKNYNQFAKSFELLNPEQHKMKKESSNTKEVKKLNVRQRGR